MADPALLKGLDETVDAGLAAAQSEYELGNIQSALIIWANLCTRFPHHSAAFARATSALLELRRLDEAEKLAELGRVKFPNEITFAAVRAKIAHDRRDYLEAISRWDEVRRDFASHSAGYTGAAHSLRESGRFNEADSLLETAILRFPDEVGPLNDHAWLAMAQGDHNLAAERWQAVRQRFPQHVAGYTAGAAALRELKSFEAAETLIQFAIERFPGHKAPILEHARLAVAQNDWSEAVQRWERVRQAYPDMIEGYVHAAASLIEMQRYAEADLVLTKAITLFPADKSLVAAHASVASHQRKWHEALARWEDAHAKFPEEKEFAQRIFETKLRLNSDESAGNEAAASNEPPPPSKPAHAHSAAIGARELVMNFESLGGTGHGCEFGIFQRSQGAEPLGLLRWADLGHDLLSRALENRFDGVGLPENTNIFVPDGADEYWTTDRRYHMAMRSFIKTEEVAHDKVTRQMYRRLQFLRTKLIEDLEQSEKIFVYKNMFRNLTGEELGRLHSAVRSYGDNTLLYIRYEKPGRPNGTVEVAGAGLIIGYIDHFSFSPTEEHLGDVTADFLTLCQGAYRMWSDFHS
jgi:tetratricopeptide (TPR) repeat protein